MNQINYLSNVKDYIELNLAAYCNKNSVELITEYKYNRWVFDWAIPSMMIAVEIEKGISIPKDTTKYNRAVIDGWRVLRYTSKNYLDLINDIKFL